MKTIQLVIKKTLREFDHNKFPKKGRLTMSNNSVILMLFTEKPKVIWKNFEDYCNILIVFKKQKYHLTYGVQ